jgi:hypothetical protein
MYNISLFGTVIVDPPPDYILIKETSWRPMAHDCNSSYSGGRDQKNGGSKPACANSSWDPISKEPFTKIGLVEWLKGKALSSTPVQHKKKIDIKNKTN